MDELKTDKQKYRRIRCIYCDKPIHINNWAGVTKKGFICGKLFLDKAFRYYKIE